MSATATRGGKPVCRQTASKNRSHYEDAGLVQKHTLASGDCVAFFPTLGMAYGEKQREWRSLIKAKSDAKRHDKKATGRPRGRPRKNAEMLNKFNIKNAKVAQIAQEMQQKNTRTNGSPVGRTDSAPADAGAPPRLKTRSVRAKQRGCTRQQLGDLDALDAELAGLSTNENFYQHPAFPVQATSCDLAEDLGKPGCDAKDTRAEPCSPPTLDVGKEPAAGRGCGSDKPVHKPATSAHAPLAPDGPGQSEAAFFASCQALVDDPALRTAVPEPVRLAAAERPGDRQLATPAWGRYHYAASLPEMRWWILSKHRFSRLVVRAAIATALHQKWRTQSNFAGRIVALCQHMRKNGVYAGWERKEQARGTSLEGDTLVFNLPEHSFHFILDVEHRHAVAAKSRNHEFCLRRLQALPSASER